MQKNIEPFRDPELPKESTEVGIKSHICPVSGIEFVVLPNGTFTMGDKWEDIAEEFEGYSEPGSHEPVHLVDVQTIQMAKYPVTQYQWMKVVEENFWMKILGRGFIGRWLLAVLGKNPMKERGRKYIGPDKPIGNVSWDEAKDFVELLNKKTEYRFGYRLPSEAEWEYAAKSGSRNDKWPGTSNESELKDYANYDQDWQKSLMSNVGSKQPNAFGLFDLSGSVWEWCEDIWHNNYDGAPANGSAWVWAELGNRRVKRGGSWTTSAKGCRSDSRSNTMKSYRSYNIGFRLVLDNDPFYKSSEYWECQLQKQINEKHLQAKWCACYEKKREQHLSHLKSLLSKKEQNIKQFVCPVTSMEFVLVPEGDFEMGDVWGDLVAIDFRPVHEVQIKAAFQLAKYPVTQAQWLAVMEDENPAMSSGQHFVAPNKPVVSISWQDAQTFIQRLNHMTGNRFKYRLPTESEWEFAARSCGSRDMWPGTNIESMLGEYTHFGQDESCGAIIEVGQKHPNDLGLYDMSGNVWEWCEDRFESNYNRATSDGSPFMKGFAGLRTIRGGSWRQNATRCRNEYRSVAGWHDQINDIGFRLARDVC